jgi:hypothetical protein
LSEALRKSCLENGLGPDFEGFVKSVEEDARDLPKREPREADIPIAPRVFWLGARRSYAFGEYVGSVLLCSLAIEAAVRELLEDHFADRRLAGFLEGLDFRRALTLVKDLGLVHKKLYDELQEFYSTRTWYSHLRFSSILGKEEEQEVEVRNEKNEVIRTEKIKDDEMTRMLYVDIIKAREHALGAMRFVSTTFNRVFGGRARAIRIAR